MNRKYRFYTIGLFIIAFLFCAITSILAQNSRLARQYYASGEYEKAGEIYLALYNQNKNSTYFTYYITCLMSLEEYDKIEEALLDEIKRNPSPDLYVSLGEMYERTSQPEKAEKQYQKAIKSLDNNRSSISKLAGAFSRAAKYDLAIETYEKATEILKDDGIYAYNLANLYYKKQDIPKMIQYYILALENNPRLLQSIKNVFSRNLTDDDLGTVTEILYERLQKNPEDVNLAEMILWVHLQRKDYSKALRQATALNLRLNENGQRIFNIGNLAVNDREFDAAIRAFQYIIDEIPQSSYFMMAKDELMKTKKLKITQTVDYDMEDIRSLEDEYESFLVEYGKNRSTARILSNLAELEALYLDNLPKAIELLKELVEIPGVERNLKNESKLKMGDYYLMLGERWEATLIYSQVDKEMQEADLGEQARYRNAKLSYYTGDFEWAQAQFDVLKASTSRLISNDAIDLSVFITDNLGLDTIPTPMEMFARAELLAFQNKFTESFSTLDSIQRNYPDHNLTDDIYFTKGSLYVKMKQYDQAISYFEKIVEEYPDEIRADNALFSLAEIYEDIKMQPDKAMEYYEKIFIDYSGSTFAVEARQRFRRLRGDNI